MFNLFQRKGNKKNWRSASDMDLYELSEQETDMLMGGSPVRDLIAGGAQPPSWQPSYRPTSFEGPYQPFPTMPTYNTWQQPPWQPGDNTQAYPRQQYPYS